MKLLYVSNFYPPNVIGGAEKVAQTLAEAMVAKGHQVSVVTLCDGADARTAQLNGVTVQSVPIRNLYLYQPHIHRHAGAVRLLWHLVDSFNPLAARDVGRIMDEVIPDLVHTHNIAGFSGAVWSQAKMRTIKCVHTMWDYHLLCEKTMLFRNGQNCSTVCQSCSFLSLPRRIAARSLSAVVAPTRAVLDIHSRAIREVPVKRVIPSGLFPAKESLARPTRSTLLTFGFLGRLQDIKGLELLLSEFETFSQDVKCKLLIGGTGDKNYVKGLTSRYNTPRIEFLGFVESNWFMQNIDLLIVPSIWRDPFPTVALEALANGVAVIGSKLGGLPEVILEGKNGLTFDPEVKGDLVRALNEAVRSGLVSGKFRVQIASSISALTAARMCDQYEQLYRELQQVGNDAQ
jgi:glycosyltransferase involved in cell wall biosynthesis